MAPKWILDPLLPVVLILLAPVSLWAQKPDPYHYPIRVPRLERPPAIDGDLVRLEAKCVQ